MLSPTSSSLPLQPRKNVKSGTRRGASTLAVAAQSAVTQPPVAAAVSPSASSKVAGVSANQVHFGSNGVTTQEEIFHNLPEQVVQLVNAAVQGLFSESAVNQTLQFLQDLARLSLQSAVTDEGETPEGGPTQGSPEVVIEDITVQEGKNAPTPEAAAAPAAQQAQDEAPKAQSDVGGNSHSAASSQTPHPSGTPRQLPLQTPEQLQALVSNLLTTWLAPILPAAQVQPVTEAVKPEEPKPETPQQVQSQPFLQSPGKMLGWGSGAVIAGFLLKLTVVGAGLGLAFSLGGLGLMGYGIYRYFCRPAKPALAAAWHILG